MEDLEIFNLYRQKDEKKIKEFKEKIESSLRVQTDYEKVIEDTEWISLMEETVPYLDNIFRNPNRFIVNEEEIVKIELARKITVESIKHLSKNTNFIQDYDKKTGDVRPSKILNINKEESYDTYENRVIYSLIQNMKFFINKKKKLIEERKDLNEKNDKHIDYTGNTRIQNENINMTLSLNTKLDWGGNTNNSSEDLLARIEKLEQKIVDVCCSEVYKILDKKHMTLVTSPIKKTNVILKNVNFQYAMKLWNYLQENLDDKTKQINEKNDYEDNEELKKWTDETFLLNYLIINTLDKDQVENEKEEQKINEQITEQMLEKIISLNTSLTQDELKDMIDQKFTIIRYRNMATIGEIQKVFKEHMEQYFKQIG